MNEMSSEAYQPGDLVEFHSSFEPFQKDYIMKNPGLVLEVYDEDPQKRNTPQSALVMWSDGGHSREFTPYLKHHERKNLKHENG
jgi:hypothetical protein